MLPSHPLWDGGPASRSPPILQLAFSGCLQYRPVPHNPIMDTLQARYWDS